MATKYRPFCICLDLVYGYTLSSLDEIGPRDQITVLCFFLTFGFLFKIKIARVFSSMISHVKMQGLIAYT